MFSVTQVVGLLHEGMTPGRVAEATLVFWLVWWAWTQFTWALNAANTDHPRIGLATLVSTGVAFFMAVAVPGAFGSGAVWFAVPYVGVRSIGLLVYWWVAADDAHRSAVQVFALASVGGLAAVLLGAVLGGRAQYWLWGAAIALDIVAAAKGGRQEGWNLRPEHFVERHGLIVIIALGESLIVAAAGLTAVPTDPDLIAVSVLSVALTCALWWAYFPRLRPALERSMVAASDTERTTMARDAFSLAHFPLLCGVIATAAAIEELILHPGDPVAGGPRAALAVGLFLFLGRSAVSAWRATGTVLVARVAVAVVVAGGVLALGASPAWAPLALGVAGGVLLSVVERR